MDADEVRLLDEISGGVLKVDHSLFHEDRLFIKTPPTGVFLNPGNATILRERIQRFLDGQPVPTGPDRDPDETPDRCRPLKEIWMT